MAGSQEKSKPKTPESRIPIAPLAIVPAPGETQADALQAVIDLDDFLTDEIASGRMQEVKQKDGTIHVVKVK